METQAALPNTTMSSRTSTPTMPGTPATAVTRIRCPAV
jgi:hypothetical protein